VLRLYIPFFLALFFLVVPKESAGQDGDLTNVSEVSIVVGKLDSPSKTLGLDEMAIKNHVFVLLQSKLPRLLVKDYADSRIHIIVDLAHIKVENEVVGYYGFTAIVE